MEEHDNDGNYAERSTMVLEGFDDYGDEQDPAGRIAAALETTRQLLENDAVAATMVAATINTRQAAGESGPAFVKRIVRSWLEEMGR